MGDRNLYRWGIAASAIAVAANACPATARSAIFALPRQPAQTAIPEFGRQADVQIIVPQAALQGQITSELNGRYEVNEGLRLLLRGTRLSPARVERGLVVLRAAPVQARTVERTSLTSTRSTRQASGMVDAAKMEPRALAPEVGAMDIIVTAQKISQNINDIGMSITALSGDQLTKAGITSPEQLVKAVPGFNYARSGYGQPIYSLRGVGFYDTVPAASPAVSIYQDQVPLAYSAMSRGVAYDIERVEVLKGPQGTLYGQNATGGAINFIARKPTDKLEAGVDVTYSSYNEVKANAYISGPITDTLRARISGGADHGGDWQYSTTRNQSWGTTRFYTGRLLLDWDATSRLKVAVNLNGWSDRSDEQQGQIVQLASNPNAGLRAIFAQYASFVPPTNARQADWDPGDTPLGSTNPVNNVSNDGFRRRNDFIQASGRMNYDLDNGLALTSITGWSRLRTSSLIDADGMNAPVYHNSTGANIKSFSQELRLAQSEGAVKWILGANYSRENVYNYGTTFSNAGTFQFRSAGGFANMRVRTLAAFANVDAAITDHLSVVAGIRYTDVRIHNEGCSIGGADGGFAAEAIRRAFTIGGVVVTIPPGGCVTLARVTFQPGLVREDLNQHNVPWKVGLNWKATDSALLYANVSRGYKAGSFSPAGAFFADQLAPATQESVLTYEAGFKVSLDDRRLQVTGAAFYYDYSNKQTRGRLFVSGIGLLNKLINIPKSTIQGGELQVTYVPSSAFRATLSGSYTHSRIGGNFTNYTVAGAIKNMDGDVLPLTPKWQVSGDAEYTLPVSGNGTDVFFGGGLHFQGASYSGLGMDIRFFNASYTNIDLRAGVRGPDSKWSVTAFVNNLTDRYSWNLVDLSGPDAIRRFANLPRIVGLRVGLRY